MLRQSGKELGNIECVSAHNTQETILLKDATHPPPQDGDPEIEEVLNKMSNIVLNVKHDFCNSMDTKIKSAMIDALPNNDATTNKFFEDERNIINEMSDAARNYICILLENTKDLK